MTARRMAMIVIGALVLCCGGLACGESDDRDGSLTPNNGGDAGGNNQNTGNNNHGSSGDTIPELGGLSGDADNHDLLYFVSPVDGNVGLFAVLPSAPSDAAISVDADVDANTVRNARNFFPIHEATWSAADQPISDFHVDRILYSHMQGVYTVSTDPGQSMPPAPRRVSSLDFLYLGGKAHFLYHLENADKTALVYSNDFEDWHHLRLDLDTDTAPALFDPDYVPVLYSWDAQAGQGDGWLVVDKSDQNTLKMVDTDLQLVSGAVTHNGQPIEGLAPNELWGGDPVHDSVQPIGPQFGDGSRLLAVAMESDTDSETGLVSHLWYYEPAGAGEPGTAHPLLNEDDDTLPFEAGALSQGRPALPAAQHIATVGDAMFFIKADALGFEADLYRADSQGWTHLESVSDPGDFMIGAAGRVAWSSDDEVISVAQDGSDRIVLEPDTRTYGQKIDTPVIGSRDGWIFYNRADTEIGSSTPFAVATKIDGSQRLQLIDARWIGASTSGRAEVSSQIGAFDLGEVFLLIDDTELGAVGADDPSAGMVSLGILPSGADDAQLFGVGPGPHRLLQTSTGGSDYEIIYVNTREQDSLVTVSPQASNEQALRPVDLF
jgi:hypothetical protein